MVTVRLHEAAPLQEHRTKSVGLCEKFPPLSSPATNGFNPYWNETFSFKVLCSDIAIVTFKIGSVDLLTTSSKLLYLQQAH